jgi:hypothetical protein
MQCFLVTLYICSCHAVAESGEVLMLCCCCAGLQHDGLVTPEGLRYEYYVGPSLGFSVSANVTTSTGATGSYAVSLKHWAPIMVRMGG